MKLRSLKLVNFRNYDNMELTFNDRLNVIYGNNGAGKTNMVEAIYALSLTKSFRTNNDKLLIKSGELSTKIEGEVIDNKTSNRYQVVINKEGKKVKIDNNLKSKISDYISNINIILLEPEEQTIFSSSPSSRRKLINIEICGLKKDYLILLNNYNKILKQRNFYIREMMINGNRSKDYLSILTNNLIKYGKKIHDYREEFINNINEYIEDKYKEIFEFGKLSIKYVSHYSLKNEEEIFKRYEKNYNREVNFGKTIEGIHHDDIVFLLDGKDISECGSNGQRKNAILAFKLSEIEVFKKEKNEYPILILDDVFSALDNKKIKNIIKVLNNNSIQTFITTTDLKNIDKELLKEAKTFKIESSKIEEA